MWNCKRILATGETGFIGSYLYEESVKNGFDLVADNLAIGKMGQLVNKVEFREA